MNDDTVPGPDPAVWHAPQIAAPHFAGVQTSQSSTDPGLATHLFEFAAAIAYLSVLAVPLLLLVTGRHVGMLLWAVCLFFFLLGLHPFVLYPLSLCAIRAKRSGAQPVQSAAASENTYAICVCAYNEETVIQSKAENLLALRRAMPNLEVLIYVDAATDRTAELLTPYADSFRVVVGSERLGKTFGMNLLVSSTAASIVIFSDANVILDPATLPNLERYFSDPDVGCVCGHLKYTNPDASATAESGSLYWRLDEWIKRLETRTGSAMGADGSLFAIRRQLHVDPPPYLIDDMFVSLQILCAQYRVIQASDVCAYEKSAVGGGEEFKRKVRISCQAFNVHRVLHPALRRLGLLNRYKYYSHKFLRWLSIFHFVAAWEFLVIGLFMEEHAHAALAMLIGPLTAICLGRWSTLRPFPQLWQILLALCATGIGVINSVRGKTFRTWTPAGSIRN